MKLVAIGPVSAYGLVTFREFGECREVPDSDGRRLLKNKRLPLLSQKEFGAIPEEERTPAACFEVIASRGKPAVRPETKKPNTKEEVTENGR